MIHLGMKKFDETQSEFRIEQRLVPYTQLNPELVRAMATGAPPDLVVINDPDLAGFLLPSGLMAAGHDGRIIGSDVSSSFASLAHAGYTQAAALYDYVEALCHVAGTTMDQLLRAQYFVADVVAFSGIAAAWSSRHGTQPRPFLCVGTPSPMPARGCALIGDFWISTATP